MHTAATSATLYFDVISPFAYLLDAVLAREPLALPVRPVPVLFAGLLKAHAHKGPAEIPRKRTFTYEHSAWLAHRLGVPFRMPAVHPFNPLRYLRLIVALEADPMVTATVFRTLFASGRDPGATQTWLDLLAELAIDPADPRLEAATVKEALRANTEEAVAAGVFGVPTLLIGEQLFWGLDALPMARAWLAGDAFFAGEDFRAIASVGVGAQRREVAG